jgi:hypothetical protein
MRNQRQALAESLGLDRIGPAETAFSFFLPLLDLVVVLEKENLVGMMWPIYWRKWGRGPMDHDYVLKYRSKGGYQFYLFIENLSVKFEV